MAYTLVGNCYIGTGALPTPIAGYDAIDTSTGNRYTSNTSSTSWVTMGNVNQTNLGNLPVTGGTMTGAITGATGWATVATPNFTSSAKRDGVDLATVNDLTDMKQEILDAVTPLITTAVASTTSAITVSSKIAFGHGTMLFTGDGTTQTIPLPFYPGNIQASESECVWLVAPTYAYIPAGSSTFDYAVYCTAGGTSFAQIDPTSTRTFCYRGSNSTFTQGYPVTVAYMIVGVRA